MASTPVRVTDELLARLDAKAAGRSRAELIAEAIERYLAPTPPQANEIRMPPSFIASLDQTAERMGLTRVEAIVRFTMERVQREYIQERARQIDRKLKAVG